MKHRIYTILTSLTISVVAQAQHINFGIKAGVNVYTIAGNNTSNYNPKIGFHAGFLGHIHINDHFAIQPEVIYSLQGTQYNTPNGNLNLSLHYINIPVLFQYMYNNGLRLQAGPQVGILVKASSKVNSESKNENPNFRSADFGITAGISYVNPATGFGVDFRYNHGLTDNNKISSDKSYNRGLQLGVFYIFGHGKPHS